MNNTPDNLSSRRDFLKNTSAAVAAGGLAASLGFPAILSGAPATGKIKIGFIGCGGRGSGAAKQALNADKNVQLVAMADAFESQLRNALRTLKNDKEVGEKVKVESTKTFVGLDAYPET